MFIVCFFLLMKSQKRYWISICYYGCTFKSWLYSSVLLLLGEGNGTHSSALTWKIPWTEEPGGLQSMGSLRVGHDWATSLFTFTALEKEMATHPSVLAWRIPGTEESGGLPSVGSHRVGHDWSDLAAAAAAAASAEMAAYRFCINTAKAEDTSLLFHVCSPA